MKDIEDKDTISNDLLKIFYCALILAISVIFVGGILSMAISLISGGAISGVCK